jgi:hypothetical protein
MMTLAEIHKSGDYLTHEKLWVQALRAPTIEYRNGYFLLKNGRWRGFDWEDVRGQSLAGKVLVIGHSDDDVTSENVADIVSASNPQWIFATNLTAEAKGNPRVRDLPLGIPNDERHSKTHIIQADDTLLRKAWLKSNAPKDYKDVVIYANFSVRNNREARGPALDAVSAVSGARIGEFVLSKKGRLRDFMAMRESGLVLCPRGNGMDTHRFWECLLLGAIPVVLETDHCARLAREMKLPAVSIRDWSDLRDRYSLVEEVMSIRSKTWDMTALTASYWKTEILRHVEAPKIS